MRMSDWSSDVCASDLRRPPSLRELRRGGAAPAPGGQRSGGRRHQADALSHLGGLAHRQGAGRGGRGGQEIGRVSCRESVCQYVSNSGVAVALKKKPRNSSRREAMSSNNNDEV